MGRAEERCRSRVEEGVVTLKGNVDSQNVDQLIRLVKGVPGVASVTDQMSVPQRS